MKKLCAVFCALTMLCNVCFAAAEQLTTACVCERMNTMSEIKTLNGYHLADTEAREQISRLSEDIGKLNTIREPMEITVTEEYIVTEALVMPTGKVMTNVESYVCTEMLPVDYDANTPVTVRCSIIGNCSMAFYDENATPVLVISGSNCADYGITAGNDMQEITVTPPDNAKFVRLSASTLSYTKPSDFHVSGIKTSTLHKQMDNIKNDITALAGAVNIALVRKTIPVSEEDVIENAFISGPPGVLCGKIVEAAGYCCTQLLPTGFKAGTLVELQCTVKGNCGLAFYDADGKVLLTIYGGNAGDYGIAQGEKQTFYVAAPEGNAYIRVSAAKASYTGPDDFVIRGMVDSSLRADVDKLKGDIASTETKIHDAKVLVLGDSISTDYYGDYPKWVTHLTEVGFFNPTKITNDSIHATGFVARYNNEANDFISRIESVSDPETYDLVIVFGGINDYIQGIPMGEPGGDKTVSFKPAVDYFFQYLVENFIQARIAVLSPLRTSNTYKNSAGHHQTEYADYIKTVAKSYCLPVLNLTEESGFYPFITTFKDMWTLHVEGYEGGDGVHPNEEYERRFLAPMIRHFLQGLM